MNELKTRFFDDTYLEYFKTGKHDLAQIYLKSEVDKVITDLKEKHKTEVKELLCLIRDKENNFNRAFDSEEKEIRYRKYRYCLLRSVIAEMNAIHFKDLFWNLDGLRPSEIHGIAMTTDEQILQQ